MNFFNTIGMGLICTALSAQSQTAYKVVITDHSKTRDTVIMVAADVDSLIISIFKQPYKTSIALEDSHHFRIEKDYVYFYCEKGILNKKGKWQRLSTKPRQE